MSALKCLYLLENPDLYILGIQRTDLPVETPVTEKLRWVKLNRSTMETAELTLTSIDASQQIEERYFEEGFLKFDEVSGTFIEKFNSAQYNLERGAPEQLDPGLSESIQALLIKRSF